MTSLKLALALSVVWVGTAIAAPRGFALHDEPQPVINVRFITQNGTRRDMESLRGKVLLVNVWATWCIPCREEMPTLDSLQKQLGSADFEVLTIATGFNNLEGIERFLAQAEVTALPILLDPDSELGAEFGAIGLPLTVILNREGQEIARLIGGAEWDSESALNIFNALLLLE